MLDEVYERYLNRKGGSTKQRKRAKRGLAIGDAELMEVFYVVNINMLALLFLCLPVLFPHDVLVFMCAVMLCLFIFLFCQVILGDSPDC